jgi:hypothetical protein
MICNLQKMVINKIFFTVVCKIVKIRQFLEFKSSEIVSKLFFNKLVFDKKLTNPYSFYKIVGLA